MCINGRKWKKFDINSFRNVQFKCNCKRKTFQRPFQYRRNNILSQLLPVLSCLFVVHHTQQAQILLSLPRASWPFNILFPSYLLFVRVILPISTHVHLIFLGLLLLVLFHIVPQILNMSFLPIVIFLFYNVLQFFSRLNSLDKLLI